MPTYLSPLDPEYDKKLAAFEKRLEDFAEKRWLACPHCGKEAERLEQIGRCVYVRPCGCRLWQGHLPIAWRENEAK